jgi:putative ABC transport system substrate-binding protein
MARDQPAYPISRRRFTWTLAGVLVAPSIAIAQASKVRRIGWLQGGPREPDEEKEVNAALAEVGWIVGQNVVIDWRYALFDDLPRHAADFVKAQVDLIITAGTPATLAAKNATKSIPILMWGTADPFAAGLVASLARPGGNVTGIALLAPEQRVKRLSLLRELLPGIRRVGELDVSTNLGLRAERRQLEEVYRTLGMEPIFVDVASTDKLDDVLAEMVRRRAQALNLIDDTIYLSWIPQLFNGAIAASLPTIVNDYGMLEAGALLSYEEDQREVLRKGALLADKLLRDAKPADLPIEQPTKFILGINLKTAKALRITIPQSLLQRADKVIQ